MTQVKLKRTCMETMIQFYTVRKRTKAAVAKLYVFDLSDSPLEALLVEIISLHSMHTFDDPYCHLL